MTVFHKQKTHDLLTLSCIYRSGKSGKGNIKNPKKSQHGQASKSSKDDYHIPKKNNLLQADSDDDKIGQSSASTQSSTNKFLCNASGLVKSVFDPKKLLSPELSSLSDNFSKLGHAAAPRGNCTMSFARHFVSQIHCQ